MKKILSFLALLMVAFALPNKASAWNFDENTDPSQVILYFSKPDGNVGDKTMSYDSTNKCWYYEFTPADTYINYYLKVWNSDQSYNTEYNKNSGPTSNGTWATVNLEKVKNETYYLSGLQKGVKCRLEIKGATMSGGTERIQVRYVQTAPVITYDILGNFPDASSTWKSTSMTNVSGSEWVAENVVVTTTSQFGIRQLTNGSQSAWFSANGTSSITASGTFNCKNDGTNFSIAPGTWTLTFDSSTNKLTAELAGNAPNTLHLFVDGELKSTAIIDGNSQFVFTTLDGVKAGAKFTISETDTQAPGTNYNPATVTALVNNSWLDLSTSDETYWTAPVNGNYNITLDWTKRQICATWEADLPTLYLYSDKPSWATKMATLNSKTGIYTTVVKMGEGTNFVLSTKNATGVDYNGLKNDIYTHGTGVTTLTSGASSSFSNTNDGCWKAPKTGEYTITVTFDESAKTGTLKATWTAPVKKVHMPLSESDFENGKKHYFLVGNRMGEWRLLPEWELKADANGDMVLNNRWIYPGGFAIGVVDSYDNYIKHKYTYYCQQVAFTDSSLSKSITASGSMTATGTVYSPSNNFWTAFSSSNGGGDYWQATGTLVTEIRVTLSDAGVPTNLAFKLGSKADANKYRFFTLVGDDIYNSNFCNTYGPATTLQKSKGQTTDNGWQEGWIQYDPVTHEPYVDGNYNYLYHTSYTPDYFKANPSLFNQTLADGSTFSYTSNEAQFVEYSLLKNLDSDPYKEFYQSFAGTTETISTGVEKSGNGYDFVVETVNGSVTPASGNNWSCYVVRDMWINGEIKIWTGWGGNDRKSGGSKVNGSTWHGENGGPATAGLQVQGYDITAGTDVKLYNNEKNVDGVNYKISDGEPVYFNRVILWYNINEGIGDSFVQFIQESAGPAIFAQLANNPNTSANNYIKYNWYLNAAQNASDSNRKVVGYQIQRYRYVDGVKTFIGYPEGDYVDISEYNVTVADLQQATAGNYSFTTFTDGGIDGISGFAPGMYQYDIVVTFADDAQKKAVSNKVAIYDSNIITPSAHALQLVRLNEAGKAALGVTQEYLTYNKAIDGKWFVLDVEKVAEDDGSGNETVLGYKPYNSQLLDGATISDFLLNNQDKYDWTSNFYIRCLDNKVYTSTFKEYISEGLVKDIQVPTPDVTAFDGYEVTSQAFRFALGEEDFYSAVLMRQGNLEQRTAQVTVSYSYTNANGTDVDEAPTMSTSLMPVTPLPYNPTYSYEIVPYELEVEGDYVEVIAPTRGNTSFDVPNSTTSAKVAATNSKLTTNLMVLNVTYNRPNVDEEILREYHVEENVAIDDSQEYSESFWFYYADEKVANVEHIFSAEGISPYNSSVPAVDFHETRYLGKWIEVDGEETVRFSDGPKGSFGQGINFSAPHAIKSTPGAGLSGVHLGKIEREGTWDWMYKGHESLADKAPVLVETGATYENQTEQTIAPNYYLYELSNGTDDMAYDFLVAHSACDHRVGDVTVDETTGFVLNDEDPLIGTYVVKGFTEETIPAVHVSSIYLFSNPQLCLIDGELPTSEGSLNTLAAELPTKDEMAAGNVGGMPDNGTVIDKLDYLTGWAVLGQTYSHTPSNNNVTGVEDVLAEGENGEVVYYNLQGIRVDNPSAAGVYVRVQGKDVKKVVIK